MLQTSYVPLEHPYQIIEYNGTLGIQIGTLIVTVDKTDEAGRYAIETHSHPVVSYVNNRLRTEDRLTNALSVTKPYEGVVWDKVELHEVHPMVREDKSMKWTEFMDFCRRVRMNELRYKAYDSNIIIADAYGRLREWGIDVKEPRKNRHGECVLYVEMTRCFEIDHTEYCMTSGDLGIIATMQSDEWAIGQILSQARDYLLFMERFYIADHCKVKFWSQDIFTTELTEKLNKKIQATCHEEYFSLYGNTDEDTDYPMAAEDSPYYTTDQQK